MLLIMLKEPDGAVKEKTKLYVEEAKKSGGLQFFMRDVKHMRIASAFKKGTARLELAVKHGSITERFYEEVGLEYITSKCKAEHSVGMGPPTQVEREMQRILDELQEEKTVNGEGD